MIVTMPSRFYTPPQHWDTASLTAEEAKHAIKVLRIREGQEIEVFDGLGRIATARVSSLSGRELQYEILSEETVTPQVPSIHLYQAIPKGKNMDFIIQKAVELGVNYIHPIITTNTIAIADNPDRKTEKWQKIALEACKQCKQPFLPTIYPPKKLQTLEIFPQELKIMGALSERAVPMKTPLNNVVPPQSVGIAVGPEGDFTPEELVLLENQGFLPVSLGSLVLRVETAALYMISAVRYQY